MLYYSVVQGEGIAGPLDQVGVRTTALYSCKGVTMINEMSNLGGLYHLSSGTAQHLNVKQTLASMFRWIVPSTILVTPAEGMLGIRNDLIAEEVREVVGFLKSLDATTNVTVSRGGSFASYFQSQGLLKFNEAHPHGVTFARVRVDGIDNVFMAESRPLDTGVLYFGVNGEDHLDQLRSPSPAPSQGLKRAGLRTGKFRPSRHCLIS